jgi:isoquinoline 1-oxidoreductase beta subunit
MSWRRRRSRIPSPIGWHCSTRHRAPKRSSRWLRRRPAGNGRCPNGFARGASLQFVFATYIAHVAEVEVSKDGAVRVRRVVCAVDWGTVVNPDTVRAQIQSGIIFGITAALHGKITLKDGRVEQANFDCHSACNFDPLSGGIGVQN